MALFNSNIRTLLSAIPKATTLTNIRSLRSNNTLDKCIIPCEIQLQIPTITKLYKRNVNEPRDRALRNAVCPLEKFCPKKSLVKSAACYQSLDTFRLNGCYFPAISFCLGVANRAENDLQWYATTKDEGGPVKKSGGGVGRLDAKDEAGFFHRINISKLRRLKAMLEEKKLHKKDDEEKTPDK